MIPVTSFQALCATFLMIIPQPLIVCMKIIDKTLLKKNPGSLTIKYRTIHRQSRFLI